MLKVKGKILAAVARDVLSLAELGRLPRPDCGICANFYAVAKRYGVPTIFATSVIYRYFDEHNLDNVYPIEMLLAGPGDDWEACEDRYVDDGLKGRLWEGLPGSTRREMLHNMIAWFEKQEEVVVHR